MNESGIECADPTRFPSSAPRMLGNINLDGHVNVDDLLAVITARGACPPPPPDCPVDVNDDGHVDVDDLLIVLNNWTG